MPLAHGTLGFRGAFLESCRDVLGELLLADAWNSKFPEEALAYGRALLAAADAAEAARAAKRPLRAVLTHLRLVKPPAPIADQLEIVRAAGRWYVFWGERGHAIRAWF
jgi:hypothetical protein